MAGNWLFGSSSGGQSCLLEMRPPGPRLTGGAWGFLPVSAAEALCHSSSLLGISATLRRHPGRARDSVCSGHTLPRLSLPGAAGSQTGVSYLSLTARKRVRTTQCSLLCWLEPFGACILLSVCFILLNFTLFILLI